jgi:adenylate cyclase
MRLVCSLDGRETTFETDQPRVVIGRAKPGVAIDLDLSPDRSASRPHAVVSQEGGEYWIEDLASASGTLVNGEDIRGLGRRRLRPGDSIQIGNTILTLAEPPPEPEPAIGGKGADTVPFGEITMALDAGALFAEREQPSEEMKRRLALLYDLPLQLGGETNLDAALQTIVDRLVAAVPRATSAALLVRDAPTGRLLLKAHVPGPDPGVSLSRVREAMDSRKAFIWSPSSDLDTTVAAFDARRVASSMYAPLLWKNEALGAFCAVNYDNPTAFSPDDLRLLLALAQHAALIIVQHAMQDELSVNASLMTRLMTNFSPKVRERLLASARTGRMRLGGQKSEVTILVADIRDFTRITAAMEPEDVVDMLNDYFAPLVDVVFRFDGTVDKFVGDAMLVVFGSPEPDPQQYEKAVRAALGMQAAAAAVSEKRKASRQQPCALGIGVHCGEVLHGFIGSNERMEYTVIGSAVNRADRYGGAAGPGEILISPELHQWVWRTVQCEPVTVSIKHEGTLPALRVKAGPERRSPGAGPPSV